MSILRKKIAHRIRTILLVSGILLFSAQTPSTKEYQVKAVFLYNFTQFVEWPVAAFPEVETPMIIGILGQDPFGSYLDQTVAKESANGHPITVKRYRNPEEIKSCHILFIGSDKTNKMQQILATLKGRSILTVSDATNFIHDGGMIRFITVNSKIQFQINPEAAKAVGISISSKLLKLAEIVVPKK